MPSDVLAAYCAGEVRLAIDARSGEERAIKIVRIEHLAPDSIDLVRRIAPSRALSLSLFNSLIYNANALSIFFCF